MVSQIHANRSQMVYTKRMPVYFVGAFLGDQLQAIKIGWSKNPPTRLADLQGHNHCILEILACVQGPTSLEGHLHREFQASRIHREWFQPSEDLSARIKAIRERTWQPPQFKTKAKSTKKGYRFHLFPRQPRNNDDELEADWKLVRPNNTGGRGHARYLVGKHFSYLEVQARAGSDKNGTSLWQCYCHLCGQTKVVSRPALTSGRVKSCGCLKAKQSSMPKATDDPKDRRPRKSIWKRLSED